MLDATLAQYIYGFEGSVAVKIFMVGFAALALVAALFLKIGLRQWLIAGMLFAAALTAPVNFEATSYLPTWLLPIQKLRAELHLALGVALTIIVVLGGRVTLAGTPAQGYLLLAAALYAGMMQFIHDTPSEAAMSIGFALGTIACMIVAASPQGKTYQDCLRTLRTMMWVSVIWTVCCSVQFVINPRYLVNTSGRFWGMLANAQQAAIFVAPLSIIALWLMLNDPQKRTKLLWLGLFAINLLFLMWTGSRTGAVMFLMGLTFVLYRRLGKAVVLFPLAALIIAGLYSLAQELQIMSNIERLTSTENTRGAVWAVQIQLFMENPLIGVGWGETGGSESSYLGGAAGYGIGYIGIIVVLMVASALLCARVIVGRSRLPAEQRPLVDLFVGWNAMYFAGAAFEGYILGRSSTPQVMMLMFAGIGVWLKQEIALSRTDAAVGEGDYEHAGDELVDEHAAADYDDRSPATA